jgi:hypothetical protein
MGARSEGRGQAGPMPVMCRNARGGDERVIQGNMIARARVWTDLEVDAMLLAECDDIGTGLEWMKVDLDSSRKFDAAPAETKTG